MSDENNGDSGKSPITIKFIVKVRRRGKSELSINIPSEYHDRAKKLVDRYVNVTVQESAL